MYLDGIRGLGLDVSVFALVATVFGVDAYKSVAQKINSVTKKKLLKPKIAVPFVVVLCTTIFLGDPIF
jgi:hypothetical protein